jgi:hypothetical protein
MALTLKIKHVIFGAMQKDLIEGWVSLVRVHYSSSRSTLNPILTSVWYS